MLPYYQYWETRIFNAISVLVLRAMAAAKTIFSGTIKRKPLIRIAAEYNHPEVTYYPSKEELANQLEKFIKNILDSAKQFGRWWKGFCTIFEEIPHPDSAELYIPYTFFDDVNESPIIADISCKIVQAKEDILKKINSSGDKWKKNMHERRLWDKNEMNKLIKQLDKNPSTAFIEKYIAFYKKSKRDIKILPHKSPSYFIVIDFAQVKNKYNAQVDEWLALLGKGL